MEATKFEKVYNAVRILIKEQKVHAIKIAELENKLDEKEKNILKLEKALHDEKDETDKRFDSVIDRFAILDYVVEEHTDTIDEIEKKADDISSKLNAINVSLKEIDKEIKELESKRTSDQKELENANDDSVENDTANCDDEIRQCWFDRVGYCNKGRDKCKFMHIEETCEFYTQNGYCNKVRCKKRHPRRCYYDQTGSCIRNEECRYLQIAKKQIQKCSNCEIKTNLTYYCDICDNDFCNHCTLKEAHVENPNKSNDMAKCKNVKF